MPPSTIALAGLDLDRVRASPLWAKLPAPALAFLQPFRNAHDVLVASDGVELLTIARGAVPGATQVAPDLALLGSPALIAAATGPHARPYILSAADTVADHPIWIAVRAGTPLPLTGNLANLNNLVTLAESMTLSARLRDDALDLELLAPCRSPAAALEFEQRLRAVASLAGVRGLQLGHEGRTVRAALTAPPGALANLLP